MIPNRPEEMAGFFDTRAGGYDEHMFSLSLIGEFYAQVAAAFPVTRERITLLDLGCGTGLELPGILARAPNALITGIDISPGMLAELRRKYDAHLHQLDLICASYETITLPDGAYDYVLSVMSLHHLVRSRKLALYERIRQTLKETGVYIEGDYVVSPAKEREFLAVRRAAIKAHGLSDKVAAYHLDIPFSRTTQVRLLRQAGFARVDVLWEKEEKAVFVANQ